VIRFNDFYKMIKPRIDLSLATLGRPEYINIREDKNINKSIITFKKHTVQMLSYTYRILIWLHLIW